MLIESGGEQQGYKENTHLEVDDKVFAGLSRLMNGTSLVGGRNCSPPRKGVARHWNIRTGR